MLKFQFFIKARTVRIPSCDFRSAPNSPVINVCLCVKIMALFLFLLEQADTMFKCIQPVFEKAGTGEIILCWQAKSPSQKSDYTVI